MHSRLFIHLFLASEQIAQSITQVLSSDRYQLNYFASFDEFSRFVEEQAEQIDCLVVLNQSTLRPLFNHLYERGNFLPVIIIDLDTEETHTYPLAESPTCLYHSGEVHLNASNLEEIGTYIDRAIARFLHLGANRSASESSDFSLPVDSVENQSNSLFLQQRRLAEKLKERLGYLGVYYKRNAQSFYRNLSREEKHELLELLRTEYRQIILNYFSNDYPINPEIDQLVNRAFFADISVSQILEMHMELMDEFAQHLKLEGRSEEILLDYRLVLIDILAHLCEMYRRSIPREDFPVEVLLRLD